MSSRVRVIKGGGRKGAQERAVSPARRVAFDILRRVGAEGAFAAPLLAAATGALSAEDRALCYELVLGVLRRRLWLDRLAGRYAGREVEAIDTPVLEALRLGLYQLRFLTRVPARAAVNESVNLAHAAGLRHAAPFVNAVLRRATREPNYDPAREIDDPLERLAVETSHPAWLVRRWSGSFGADEAAALARANNEPAPVSFRLNTLKEESAGVVEQLRAAGSDVEPSRLAPGAWRMTGGGATSLLRALAAEGLVYSQDEASQLVAHVVGPREGERVLDVCAAPGGKTTHMAALAADRAFVVAGDVYGHRLRLVAEACDRLGIGGVRLVGHDVEGGLPFAAGSFDRVLVDAPCTGTGTLRHNPEIRWRLTPEDIPDLAARQLRILRGAAVAVRPGGRLVYSTCSVEPEENEDVASAFLAAEGGFRQVAAEPAPDKLLAARTWPHRDNTDGFFVAAFEKL